MESHRELFGAKSATRRPCSRFLKAILLMLGFRRTLPVIQTREFRTWCVIIFVSWSLGTISSGQSQDTWSLLQDVPLIQQVGTSLCWAACAEIVMSNMHVSVLQCVQANDRLGLDRKSV